jgi:hypothetical protein
MANPRFDPELVVGLSIVETTFGGFSLANPQEL